MARRGFRPSISEAQRGMCCECMANYGDGRVDCGHTHCPIYSKHQFRTQEPIWDWFFESWSNHDQLYRVAGMTRDAYLDQQLGTPRKVGYVHMFRAKCYRCCGHFRGGMKREDCGLTNCPIYYWMPYREMLPDYDWMFDLDYTDKHRVAATVGGYILKGKRFSVFDRHRYIADILPWTGEPLPQPKQKRIRRIT